MEKSKRIDVFVNVHKGLRRGLLGLSAQLGSLNWSDAEEVRASGAEVDKLLHFLREHAQNEDLVQVPFLEGRSPGTTRRMVEDHQRLEKTIDDLEEEWKKVVTSQGTGGYRLYRRYNQFLSEYLAHMDMEEGEITEAIYRDFTDAEIAEEFKKIIARTSPQDMGMMLSYMIPGMNHSERLGFLNNLKNVAPPEVFEKVKGLAQNVLEAKAWEKLKEGL